MKGTDDPFQESLDEVELFRWLDIRVERVTPGRVVFELPYDDKFTNLTTDSLHGGITATVIDTASGFALRSTFDDPREGTLTTTDLNVRYVRPARDDIRVDVQVVRAGKSVGVTEAEVTTVNEGERKVVATGGTSYRLFRDGGTHNG